MSVWRCSVCEGVNQGGMTCTACGAVMPHGEPLRAAVRSRLPSADEPAPPPVPPTPRRRKLRELPARMSWDLSSPTSFSLVTVIFEWFPCPAAVSSPLPLVGLDNGPGN
jgi:hypothetical protein